jgi:hypothetical protein
VAVEQHLVSTRWTAAEVAAHPGHGQQRRSEALRVVTVTIPAQIEYVIAADQAAQGADKPCPRQFPDSSWPSEFNSYLMDPSRAGDAADSVRCTSGLITTADTSAPASLGRADAPADDAG